MSLINRRASATVIAVSESNSADPGAVQRLIASDSIAAYKLLVIHR